MHNPAKYIPLFVLAVVLVLLYPVFALMATPLEALKASKAHTGALVLDAEGNGQTYFVHFASGTKYYTGQVSKETGQALADSGAWIGMTKADLAQIPSRGTAYTPIAYGEVPESLHNRLEPVNQGLSNACVAYTLGRITGLPALELHEQFGGGDLGVPVFHANSVMEELGYEVHTVAGWYTGTDAQIETVKRALMEHDYLASGVDTIRNWDDGAKYPSNREYSVNHMFTLAGWDEDGWIIYSSYGEGAGTLRYDYPMLWIFGYTQ